MKKELSPSFADLAVAKRKIKSEFFAQIDLVVDWLPISNLIDKYAPRGESASGKPAYQGLLLFKMALLQTWYGLSDYEIEDRLNDSISFGRFCQLPLDQAAPDHSTLSRFRTELTEKGVYEKLFKGLNRQLEKHRVIVKNGAIVDASIVDTPLKPKGRPTYEVVEDRKEEAGEGSPGEGREKALLKTAQPGADTDAAWIKKAGKLRYGYKKHVVTDQEGMVLGVLTTPANVNEISNLKEVLDTAGLPEGIPLKADKGYQSAKNRELLRSKKLKDHILKRAYRNRPLTPWEKKFNKLVGRTRYKVERTFGSVKRWFGSTGARYRGLAKMHTQNLMEAMAYNLYRSPGIIMSGREK